MIEVGIGVVLLAAMVSLVDWRAGVYLIAVAGIFQDPFRKLVPGQPVSIQLMVVALFAATLAGLYKRHGNLKFKNLIAAFPGIRRPLLLLVWYLVLQHVVTIVKFQNIPFLAIGAITYFTPLLAVMIGFSFARSRADSAGTVSRYLLLYVTLVVFAASGIIFDFFGFTSDLLKPVGEGMFIYGPEGQLKLYQGLFRASEIAAWHIGTALCLLLTLATIPGHTVRKVAAVILVPLLLSGAILTGRRKVLMLILIFLAFYFFIQLMQRQGRRSYYPVVLLLAGLGIGLYVGDFFDLSSPRDRMSTYLRRGGTVLEASPERFNLLGIQSVYWALKSHGSFGVGAGALGQGGQYYGRSVSGSAEGGLGKITAELGLPGLLLAGWLFLVAIRETRVLLGRVAAADPGQRHLVAGLVAILAANVPNFIVASQAYGDPFVILSLGVFAGFAAGMGVPRAAAAPATARQAVSPLERVRAVRV